MLCVVAISLLLHHCCHSKDTRLSLGTFNRDVPLYGIGNEFIFQQLNDTQLDSLIKTTHSSIQRFPGGTPSDYWLWNIGWVNTSSFHTNLPELQALPSQYNKYLTQTQIKNTILVTNQLTSNLSFQIEGIHAHANAHTQIKYIELGNEMYDNTRSDVIQAYPNPSDYAQKMVNWSTAIYNQFPNTEMALVGWGVSNISNHGYTSHRESIWNDQVLNNVNLKYPKTVTSATIHLYYSLGYVNVDNSDKAVTLLQQSFANIRYDSDYWSKSISDKYDLWVTEMGTYGNNKLLYTWIEALYMGVLELYIPLNSKRIKMIVPYCVVCGDPNMPAFIFNNNTNKYDITAIGILESMLVSEIHNASKMTVLNWNGNNSGNDCLIGWRLDYSDNVSKAMFINVDESYYDTAVDANILSPNCGINQLKMKSIYADSFDVLIKTHSAMTDLKTNITSIVNGVFSVPPWSINVVYC